MRFVVTVQVVYYGKANAQFLEHVGIRSICGRSATQKLVSRKTWINQRDQQVEYGTYLQCFLRTGPALFMAGLNNKYVWRDHSTFFIERSAYPGLFVNFTHVLFDDIVGPLTESRAIVAVFGNVISGSATNEAGASRDIEGVFPSPPSPQCQ